MTARIAYTVQRSTPRNVAHAGWIDFASLTYISTTYRRASATIGTRTTNHDATGKSTGARAR